jgi:hypothetical protein
MKLLQWFAPPDNSTIDRKNFINVQFDAVGVGLACAVAPFLPVFLTRLGASNFQVGLLTSLPAFIGLCLSIAAGRFLHTRRNIVPWYAATRLVVTSAYGLIGLAALLVPENRLVLIILAIWGLITLPQVIMAITFSVTMNAVAGPNGRFELMSRRWSILGITTTIGMLAAGQILYRVVFPFNYIIVFIGSSGGSLISYLASSQICLSATEPPAARQKTPIRQGFREYTSLLRQKKPFLSQVAKRFVYLSGTNLLTPLFPLYFVHIVHASDEWIGFINTAQTATLIVGYFFWIQQIRRRRSRQILMITTLGMSLYPAIVALTRHAGLIVLFSGISGMFQAGIDLLFFDELMKTVPVEHSAMFVSLDQTVQYLSAIIAPLAGIFIADLIGLGGALIVGAGIRFIGSAWFLIRKQLQLETPSP